MQKVRILGVDPSLRNTGLAVVNYNNDLPPSDPKAFEVTDCQVLVNPTKYKGKDAILNMIDMMAFEAKKPCYAGVDQVLVESPATIFNQAWGASTMSLIAHISGAAIALFGLEKGFLFRPSEWNKTRKKEVTHHNTVNFLGAPDKWHYEKIIKSDKYFEHILDAASLALWWIKSSYIEEV